MKQIVCELCGSTEFVKQDGVFVCQSCGTKYSLEEARKLMVEVEGAAAPAPSAAPAAPANSGNAELVEN